MIAPMLEDAKHVDWLGSKFSKLTTVASVIKYYKLKFRFVFHGTPFI